MCMRDKVSTWSDGTIWRIATSTRSNSAAVSSLRVPTGTMAGLVGPNGAVQERTVGVAETLDWISSLLAPNQVDLVEGPVRDTLGALLKYQDDVEKVMASGVRALLGQAAAVQV